MDASKAKKKKKSKANPVKKCSTTTTSKLIALGTDTRNLKDIRYKISFSVKFGVELMVITFDLLLIVFLCDNLVNSKFSRERRSGPGH